VRTRVGGASVKRTERDAADREGVQARELLRRVRCGERPAWTSIVDLGAGWYGCQCVDESLRQM
jgi:hypothetical protein